MLLLLLLLLLVLLLVAVDGDWQRLATVTDSTSWWLIASRSGRLHHHRGETAVTTPWHHRRWRHRRGNTVGFFGFLMISGVY
jgi:hypothetical protein